MDLIQYTVNSLSLLHLQHFGENKPTPNQSTLGNNKKIN